MHCHFLRFLECLSEGGHLTYLFDAQLFISWPNALFMRKFFTELSQNLAN
jgi:hypothetical protein